MRVDGQRQKLQGLGDHLRDVVLGGGSILPKRIWSLYEESETGES